MSTNLNNIRLLPPSPDACPECACHHRLEEPHNRDSLFYQTKFQMENNRPPSWFDAMVHCAPDIKDIVCQNLIDAGIKL